MCGFCITDTGSDDGGVNCDCSDTEALKKHLSSSEYSSIAVSTEKLGHINFFEATLLFVIVAFSLLSLPFCPTNKYAFVCVCEMFLFL